MTRLKKLKILRKVYWPKPTDKVRQEKQKKGVTTQPLVPKLSDTADLMMSTNQSSDITQIDEATEPHPDINDPDYRTAPAKSGLPKPTCLVKVKNPIDGVPFSSSVSSSPSGVRLTRRLVPKPTCSA